MGTTHLVSRDEGQPAPHADPSRRQGAGRVSYVGFPTHDGGLLTNAARPLPRCSLLRARMPDRRESLQQEAMQIFFGEELSIGRRLIADDDMASLDRLGELVSRYPDQGIASDIDSLTMPEALGVAQYLSRVHAEQRITR
jgi:hypothetical protein